MGQAETQAGGSPIQIINTEIAFGHVAGLRIVLRRAIGTSPRTITTAHAFRCIEESQCHPTEAYALTGQTPAHLGGTMVAGNG